MRLKLTASLVGILLMRFPARLQVCRLVFFIRRKMASGICVSWHSLRSVMIKREMSQTGESWSGTPWREREREIRWWNILKDQTLLSMSPSCLHSELMHQKYLQTQQKNSGYFSCRRFLQNFALKWLADNWRVTVDCCMNDVDCPIQLIRFCTPGELVVQAVRSLWRLDCLTDMTDAPLTWLTVCVAHTLICWQPTDLHTVAWTERPALTVSTHLGDLHSPGPWWPSPPPWHTGGPFWLLSSAWRLPALSYSQRVAGHCARVLTGLTAVQTAINITTTFSRMLRYFLFLNISDSQPASECRGV